MKRRKPIVCALLMCCASTVVNAAQGLWGKSGSRQMKETVGKVEAKQKASKTRMASLSILIQSYSKESNNQWLSDLGRKIFNLPRVSAV